MKNALIIPYEPNLGKSGRKVAETKSTRISKSGLRSWTRKVKNSTKAYYGKRKRSEYVIRIQFAGRRFYEPLGTDDLDKAAKRAQQFYFDIRSVGIEVARTRLRPKPKPTPADRITVGEYLKVVEEIWPLVGSRMLTFHEYCAKFRTLISHLFDVRGKATEKWAKTTDRVTETPWQKRIHAIRISDITPKLVSDWMLKFLKSRKESIRAHNTVNCLVRCSRSLFSARKVLPHLEIELPKPLPFDGIKLLPVDLLNFRFRPEANARELIKNAKLELSANHPELYKIFLLGIGAGLRRGEIDSLRWHELLKAKNVVWVTQTDDSRLKSKSAARAVKIPPDFYLWLEKQYGDSSLNDFVVDSSRRKQLTNKSRSYRCAPLFRELITWLRKQGIVRETKAVHALRKHFGDEICTHYGIYNAKTVLGHQKVSTTEIFYTAPPEVEAAPFTLD